MSFIRECFENLKVDLTNSLMHTHCVCAYLYGRQPSGYRQGERDRFICIDFFIIHRFGLSSGVQTLIIYVSIVWCDVHQLWRVCSKAKIKPPQTIESFERFESQSLAKSTKKNITDSNGWMVGRIFSERHWGRKKIVHAFNKILHSNISLMSINNWQTLNDLFGFIHRRTRTDALCHGDVYIVQKGSRLKFTDILILTSIGPSN